MSARLLRGALVVIILSLLGTSSLLAQASASPNVVTSWDDVVKLGNGQTATYHFTVTYDSAINVYSQNMYDSSGALVSSHELEGFMTPTEAEIEAAEAVIMNDAELGSLASRADVRIDGGFILATDGCEHTRCLQFEIGEFGTDQLYRYVVVDLVNNEIMHRNYNSHLLD